MPIPLQQYGTLLAGYLKPQQGRVISLAIALLSSIALQIINPQILGYFIDTAVQGGSQQALLTATIALLTQATAIAATEKLLDCSSCFYMPPKLLDRDNGLTSLLGKGDGVFIAFRGILGISPNRTSALSGMLKLLTYQEWAILDSNQ
ncbi:hypothetical protein [Myxacorys almedinensis]|uniref:hypothetical protein n=1 Tax=Myxacorys almedinensis TaxID=2651157 RepID=UPI00192E811A|nr:hypothetical protein [Myxacorys almedinensis]